MIIMDSFALPVQGTETRVNAGNEAIEYMSQYTEGSERVSIHFKAVALGNHRDRLIF